MPTSSLQWGIRWSKRILFPSNYRVKKRDYKNRNDHILVLSSTNLLSMHKKETACFLPDWPYTSREREGVGGGAWLRGLDAQVLKGSGDQSFPTPRATPLEARDGRELGASPGSELTPWVPTESQGCAHGE